MATRPPPAPAPTAPPAQPIGTPPGGGRWTWDAQAAAWVPLPDLNPAEPDIPDLNPAEPATQE